MKKEISCFPTPSLKANTQFTSPDIGEYRYFFNGQEGDNEVYENGGFQNYGFRMYDTRIARFWGIDPLTKNYPMLIPFQFASNTPIRATDLDGQAALYHQKIDKIKRKAIAIAIKKSQEILTTMIKSIVNQFDNKVKKKNTYPLKIHQCQYRGNAGGNLRFKKNVYLCMKFA